MSTSDNGSVAGYFPLRGVRVLDLGILIPTGLVSHKLAALGADVVKIEEPNGGDRIRDIRPDVNGDSPYHMTHSLGKRSVTLDLREPADREVFLRLAAVADVILENQLPGRWESLGIDFEAMRRNRPALVILSITGFGQTGPLRHLPSHGLNMDALGGTMNVVAGEDGQAHIQPIGCWGNELGATNATTAICAALLSARTTGEGAWIDLSCWDAVVETHRALWAQELRWGERANEPGCAPERTASAFYDTYTCKDGRLFLMGTLEKKSWLNVCLGVGREDLIGLWNASGKRLDFATGNVAIRHELESIFREATAAEWMQRFVAWDAAGSEVLYPSDILDYPHLHARGLVEHSPGDWPRIATAIRWQHTGTRAGTGMAPPPTPGEHTEEVIAEWLG